MSISSLALAAKKVIEAAWLNAPPYDLATLAAEALESAQLLQSPETAAEAEHVRADLAQEELAYERLRVAQESAKRGRRELRARVAELETTSLAWTDRLDAKSLDNFLISLAAAAEHEPMDGAIVRVDEVIRSFREAALGAEPDPASGFVSELVVYRAYDGSMLLGTYTTPAAARAHCEATARQKLPTGSFAWISDPAGGGDLVEGDMERLTGYVVTALAVASKYAPEADE